jgi:hypothetical protein
MAEIPKPDEETLEARRQEVLAAVGVTLLSVQSAEKVVQGSMRWALPRQGITTLEDLERQTAEEAKKTLGYFLDQLRRRAFVEEQFDADLKEFLQKRNTFAHDLVSVEGINFNTIDGLGVANTFLFRLTSLPIHVTRVFMGLIRLWQQQIGMKDDFADNEFFRHIDEEYRPLAEKTFFRKPQ